MKLKATWLPRVLVESALITFSILLALAVNEWNERRERAQRVAIAVEAIRSELAANRREVASTQSYHASLSDTLFAYAERGIQEYTPGGLIRASEVVFAAWRMAQATAAVSDMPQGAVLIISRTYQEQQAYVRRREALLRSTYEYHLRNGPDAVRQNYVRFAGLLSDIADWEQSLLRQYDRALRYLAGGSSSTRSHEGDSLP